MKKQFFIPLLFFTIMSSAQTGYVKLSQDLLYAVKTGDPLSGYLNQLNDMQEATLGGELNSDDKRKAFWLNIYNAFVQLELHKDPDQYKNRNSFYKKKFILIAGKLISPDLVEHGILRHSKTKWSLGYIGKLFPTEFEKRFRVNKTDKRIHFALNCGAKSCPPIAFYDPEKIDAQLDLAAKNYLRTEVISSEDGSIIRLPSILGWFRADFNGKKGMLEMLRQYKIIEPTASPKIKFKKYDWDLELKAFAVL